MRGLPLIERVHVLVHDFKVCSESVLRRTRWSCVAAASEATQFDSIVDVLFRCTFRHSTC